MKRLVAPVAFLQVGLVIAVILALGALGISCGGGTGVDVEGSRNVVSEDRPVSGITGVDVDAPGDLTIEVGDRESLRVEAEDNLLQYLQTSVTGGVLSIRQAEGFDLHPKKSIRYYLTVKTLTSIESSNKGDISAPVLTTDRLSVRLTSSGKAVLAGVQADLLEVNLTSSGRLEIRGGQVATLQVRLVSSAKYDAGDVRTGSAEVELTSSGGATIWVTDHLQARLTSSGGLRYYGSSGLKTDIQETSSGKAQHLGDK